MTDFGSCIARPGQLLIDHLIEVADIASRCGVKVGFSLLLRLIGLLHDVGKCNSKFAEYMERIVREERVRKGSVDHSTAGAQFMWRNMPLSESRGEMKLQLLIRQMVALCCASHHAGTLLDCFVGRTNKFAVRLDKGEDEAHYEEVLSLLPDELKEELCSLMSSDELLSELKAFDDRVEELMVSERIKKFHYGMLSRFLLSCLVEGDHTSAAGTKYNDKIPDWGMMRERLETHMESFDKEGRMNELRSELSDLCLQAAEWKQGTYLLNLPTGSGKTLASLRYALRHAEKYGLERIIYVIPYTSIIEQNVRSARKALGDTTGEMILEHHSNVIHDSQDGEEGEYDDYLKTVENWDAPIVFTTSVQVLNAMFSDGASNVRRFHALARSVLIFDEIQTLPVHSIHLFNNAINFLKLHAGTTTLLCTATQPLLSEVNEKNGVLLMESEPHIVPEYEQYFEEFDQLRNLEIEVFYGEGAGVDVEGMASKVLELSKEGNSVLVIVNTKKLAKDVYEACRKDGGASVYHLSTNMCPAHRRNVIENKLSKKALAASKERGERVICVSTQLIEAGVDVDFDVVVKTLSGLDSLAQAAGRCNRDGKSELGKVIIVRMNPKCEQLTKLKLLDIARQKADRVIDEWENEEYEPPLLSGKWVRGYFSYYYQAFSEDELAYKCESTNLVDMLSENARMETGSVSEEKGREYPLKQSFAKAGELYKVIDSETTSVIVPYKEEDKEDGGKVYDGRLIIEELIALFDSPFIDKKAWEKCRRLVKRAQQFSVSLWDHQLEMLRREGNLLKIAGDVEIYYVSKGSYLPEWGVCLNGDNSYKINDDAFFM